MAYFDWDLTQWRTPVIFNLELMKLSTYNKVVLKNIVQMEHFFQSEECTKVYIQKDYEDFLYPSEIISDPKVIWGGLALSEGKYSPMPIEIEQSIADVSIYEKMKKYYNSTNNWQRLFKIMMNAQHLRLSLENNIIFNNCENQLSLSDKKTSHIIFHDKNITEIKDSNNYIRYLGAHYGKKRVYYGFKFPLIIQNDKEFEDWGTLPKIQEMSALILDYIVSDEILDRISLVKQQIVYRFSSKKWTKEKIIDNLSKILLQGIFLSNYSIILLLKIDRSLSLPNELQNMIVMLNSYFSSITAYRTRAQFNVFTFCKFVYTRISRENKIEMFKFFKDNNSDFFDLLYYADGVKFTNNHIVPIHYTTQEILSKGGYGANGPRKESDLTIYKTYD